MVRMNERFQQLKKLNHAPLNRAALDWLKQAAPELVAPEEHLGVLSLMLWALENNQVESREEDELMSLLLGLDMDAPEAAMRYLEESPGLPGEVVIFADELRSQDSPAEAAEYLLEALLMQMRARHA
jgi:hypothetical protein